MATPIRFSPIQVRSAINQARSLGRRRPYPLPVIHNQPSYVRPRITGMVVGDEPIPSQRPSFGGPGGIMPPAGAPPATTPSSSPSGQPATGEIPPWKLPIPGQGHGPLSWNPQLVFPNLGPAGDAQYMADVGHAQSTFNTSYHKALRQLGYLNEFGNYQEGDINLQAQTNRALYNIALGKQETDVTNRARDLGTLWSGARVRDLADTQFDTIHQLSDLDLQQPRDLAQQDEDITGFWGDYYRAIEQAMLEAQGRYDDTLGP